MSKRSTSELHPVPQIAREETRCRHICYSFRLAARVLLYASCHRQDKTHHSLCYTRRGALAGTRNMRRYGVTDAMAPQMTCWCDWTYPSEYDVLHVVDVLYPALAVQHRRPLTRIEGFTARHFRPRWKFRLKHN